jgi:hypothetical protein
MTYKQRVQLFYPESGCIRSERPQAYTEIQYYDSKNQSPIWPPYKRGWVSIGLGTNAKLAWKDAWVRIQEEMIRKLEE